MVYFKGIFGSSFHEFSPLSFFFILGKIFLMDPKKKHPSPLFIFILPHPTKHTLKKFLFLFSFQSFPSIIFHLQTNTPLRHPSWQLDLLTQAKLEIQIDKPRAWPLPYHTRFYYGHTLLYTFYYLHINPHLILNPITTYHVSKFLFMNNSFSSLL